VNDLLPIRYLAAAGLLDETGIAILGGIGVFLTILLLGRAFVWRDPMEARLRNHSKRRALLVAQALSGVQSSGRARGKSVGFLRGILEKLKLLRGEEANKMIEQLARAGWRSRDMLVIFLAARLMLPVIGAVAAWLTSAALFPGLIPLHRMIVVAIGIAIGGYGPVLFLRNMVNRRQQKLKKQLPDALDLLVICAEAGLSLDSALTRVAREFGPTAPELADELGLTAIELGFLPNRRQALANLIKRADIPSIRGVVNTLIQTERYGTPLAHSLRVLAAEFRDERLMKAEEKAARLPAILTVPMIVFILPALFVVLIGPAIIQVIKTFS